MNTHTDSPNNTQRSLAPERIAPERIAPERIAPERIARMLTHAVQQLDGHTVAALRRAHNAALEKQSQRKPVFALSAGHGMHWLILHSAHQWAATAILFAVILFGGVQYWEHTHESEVAHLDIAILTDDLPLEVFVD